MTLSASFVKSLLPGVFGSASPGSWQDLEALREESRRKGVEGFMLKRDLILLTWSDDGGATGGNGKSIP